MKKPTATIIQTTVVGTRTHEVEIDTDSVGEFRLPDVPDIGDLRGTQYIIIVFHGDTP